MMYRRTQPRSFALPMRTHGRHRGVGLGDVYTDSGDSGTALGQSFVQESALEIAATNGSVVFRNLTGPYADRLCLGDKWELRLTHLVPNADLFSLGGADMNAYPPPYKKIGQTDGSGNFLVSGVADTVGSFYQTYWILFPISLYGDGATNSGYAESFAPSGYRYVLLSIVAFTVLGPSVDASGNLMANDAVSVLCGCNAMNATASAAWNATHLPPNPSGYMRGRPTCLLGGSPPVSTPVSAASPSSVAATSTPLQTGVTISSPRPVICAGLPVSCRRRWWG